MQTVDIVRSSDVVITPRLKQMMAMFDLSIDGEKLNKKWRVSIDLDWQWNIGLIVGPSGCGKTTVAVELFGEKIINDFEWDEKKSIIDNFPQQKSIKEIVKTLSSVGLSSPPAWCRPFKTLSNGERFRATMARALVENDDLFVIDEYSSVISREIAKIGSHAIQKTIRQQNKKFVAVSCHYDIIDWLQPDWIYEPHKEKFHRRSLQRRPFIDIECRRCSRRLWRVFRDHHYLSGDLHPAAQCYVGLIDEQPAVFCAVIHMPHPKSKNLKREHRLVCLPDYQGCGIGNIFSEYIASMHKAVGLRYLSVTGHPSMIRYRSASKNWIMKRAPKAFALSFGNKGKGAIEKRRAISKRNTASFEYVGPAHDLVKSRKMIFG